MRKEEELPNKEKLTKFLLKVVKNNYNAYNAQNCHF